MGVQGLWQLLTTLGSPVPLESFENKVLSVDISIWLNQILKGYRDAQGQSISNSHLLGLFHRLCKLLFYKIKPIVVFDGGVPQLKRQTLAERQRRKEVAQQKSNKAQLKICANYLASQLLQSKSKKKKTSNLPKSQSIFPDLYELAPLPESQVDAECEDDALIGMESETEFDHFKDYQDLKSIDIESEDFHSLPYEIKQEILVNLRENRKRKWTAIEQFPDESSDFSKYQVKNLIENRYLQQKITEVEKEINRVASSQTYLHYLDTENCEDRVFETKKIASEDFSHFILMKKLEKSPCKKKVEISNVNQSLHEEKAEYKESHNLEICYNHSLPLQNPEERDDSVAETAHENFEELCFLDTEAVTIKDPDIKYQSDNVENVNSNCNKISSAYVKEKHCSEIFPSMSENIATGPLGKHLEEKTVLDNTIECNIIEFIPQTESFAISPTFNLQNETNIISFDNYATKSLSGYNRNLPYQASLSLNDIQSGIGTNNELFIAEKDISDNTNINRPNNLKNNIEILPHSYITNMPASSVSNEINTMYLPQSSEELSSNISHLHDINSNSEIKIKQPSNVDLPKTVEAIFKQEDVATKKINDNKDKQNSLIPSSLSSFKATVLPGKNVVVSENKVVGNFSKTILIENTENEFKDIPLSENLSSVFENTDKLEDTIPSELEALHEAVCDKLNQETAALQIESAQHHRIASTVSEQMYDEIKELLHLFGIPYIVSPMEAEAQCAFLDYNDLTHGTITDDSDIWLFGGQRVYRNFFQQKKYVEFFKATEILSHFGLTQQKLISFAILAGCDYSPGIEGVGPVTAMEILSEFPGDGLEPLYLFKSWLESVQKHSTAPKNTTRVKLQNITLPSGFPNQAVYDAYFNPEVNSSKEPFSWSTPDLDGLREFSRKKFGWSKTKIDGILLPVMKRVSERQASIEKFFTVQLKKHENLFPSKRIQDAVRHLNVKSSVTKTTRSAGSSRSNEQKLNLKEKRKYVRQKKQSLQKAVMSHIKKLSHEMNNCRKSMVHLSEESSSEND